MSKTKAFDCVEMKRLAALKLHERLSKMSDVERREYWRKGDTELREKWLEMRRKAGLPVPADGV